MVIHNVLFSLNSPTKGAVNITNNEDGIIVESSFEGEYMTMATNARGLLVKDSIQPLHLRSRYVFGSFQMVLPKPVIKGKIDIVEKSKFVNTFDEDGLLFKIQTNGETKTVGVLGGKGLISSFKKVEIGGLDIYLQFGAKVLELPFSIKLNDFEAERYPGTERGSS